MKIENGCLTKVYNNEITDGKFIIPEGVTSIGNEVFYACSSLTSIIIPNSVISIGKYAFERCTEFKSITIPNSVTSIDNGAFYRCSGLTSIAIPDSVTHIGNYAFFDCSSLTSVTIGNGDTSIGCGAFQNCSELTSVTIGNGVKSIGACAFACCTLTSKQANYKAFQIINEKFRCIRKTYSEGKRHYVRGALKICENGIHYCTNLFEIFNYYSGVIDKDIAIYEIDVGDKVLTSDSSKCCTNSCVLKKRLYHDDIIKILNGENT